MHDLFRDVKQILYAFHLFKENLSNEKRSFLNYFSTQAPEVSLLVGVLHVLYFENGKVMGEKKRQEMSCNKLHKPDSRPGES